MKVRSNINAGGIKHNHNENMKNDDKGSIESKKTFAKKLHLNKETIRELKETELKHVAGGAACTGSTSSVPPTSTCL